MHSEGYCQPNSNQVRIMSKQSTFQQFLSQQQPYRHYPNTHKSVQLQYLNQTGPREDLLLLIWSHCQDYVDSSSQSYIIDWQMERISSIPNWTPLSMSVCIRQTAQFRSLSAIIRNDHLFICRCLLQITPNYELYFSDISRSLCAFDYGLNCSYVQVCICSSLKISSYPRTQNSRQQSIYQRKHVIQFDILLYLIGLFIFSCVSSARKHFL